MDFWNFLSGYVLGFLICLAVVGVIAGFRRSSRNG